MKRTSIAIACAAAAIGLMACQEVGANVDRQINDELEHQTVTTNADGVGLVPPESTEVPALPSGDDLYVLVVRSGLTSKDFKAFDDDRLVNIGHLMCDLIDTTHGDVLGAQKLIAVQLASSNAAKHAPEVGWIMGAAINTYCPQYADQIG